MEIIESTTTPGGSERVPYGDGACQVEYMDTYSGVIERESNEDFMRSGDWIEEAEELIYEEISGDLTLKEIRTYCDFSWREHPNKPGTYLIKYEV